MSKQYVIATTGDYYTTQAVYLTAGSQGLTVVGCEVTSSQSGTNSMSVTLAHSVVGGTALSVLPLDESDPAALATATVNVISYTSVGALAQWQFAAPTSGVLDVCRRPITIAPGSSLQFQTGASYQTPFNIYFEE